MAFVMSHPSRKLCGMRMAYKCRAYPDPDQQVVLMDAAGHARHRRCWRMGSAGPGGRTPAAQSWLNGSFPVAVPSPFGDVAWRSLEQWRGHPEDRPGGRAPTPLRSSCSSHAKRPPGPVSSGAARAEWGQAPRLRLASSLRTSPANLASAGDALSTSSGSCTPAVLAAACSRWRSTTIAGRSETGRL
jgi:hypothetical protein